MGEEEIAAIERGESLRQTVEQSILRLPALDADPRAVDALELLAWMIANGHLDVKVAVPCDADRNPVRDDSIFHEKTGIIEDKTGDRIAFNGSINETEFGCRPTLHPTRSSGSRRHGRPAFTPATQTG